MFYLGTHRPGWLWRDTPPLFVSRRQLQLRSVARMTPVPGRWALDSGGFTELTLHGRWTLPVTEYVDMVATYADRMGGLDFAAPQDWMCEPHMLERTGLTVAEHQERTVANFLDLRDAASDLPFIPVLQGWEIDDYHRCVELYASAGVDLGAERLVGLGSVCRRQNTPQIGQLVTELADEGLSLHGFGVKVRGVLAYGHRLASADSLAWSFRARRAGQQPGCAHQNCANCMRFALAWHDELMDRFDDQGAAA